MVFERMKARKPETSLLISSTGFLKLRLMLMNSC